MLVEQIYQMLLGLVDDPDGSFMSSAQYVLALQQGYREFRNMVFKMAPEVYETFVLATVAGVPFYGLNTIIFGATTTSVRASRITRVASYEPTTGQNRFLYDAAGSLEQLSADAGWNGRWLLQGTVLQFSRALTDTLKIYYLPADQVNWTGGIVTGSNVFVDDLGDFHDLIALLAAKQYAIKDYALNPVLAEQLKIRTADLTAWLSMGRTGDAYRWVQSEDQGW